MIEAPKKFQENPSVATEIKKNATEHFGLDQDGVAKKIAAEILLTKANVGLGNVPDVTTNNQAPTYTIAEELAELASGEVLSTAFGKLAKEMQVVIAQLDGKSAYRGTLLESGYNLNSIAKTGTYTAPANAVNSPSFSEVVSDIHYIVHINSDSTATNAVQIAIGATTSHIYIRNKIGNTWSAWSTGVTPTEIGYLKSVTSNIQTQLNALGTDKQNISEKTIAWSEEPNDQRYPTEKLVKDSLDEQAGRLDTLEGTGEGSVFKAIDDAVSPLAEVVDTNRLYSDSQYLALKAKADAQALEIQASRAELYNGYKILQFGSTEIIGKGTKADYSAVDVSANVVDGSLEMEQKGLTIRNLVNGASIANLGTVTFATILNAKYYDTLNNAILTGTGSDMTATNNSGATANMGIYHLNAHGLQAITDTAILAKLLPYVNGTQNVPKLGLQILDADDAVTQTIFLPAIGNRVPNGTADSIKTVADGWEHTKRVQEYTLRASDVTTLLTSNVNNDVVYIKKPLDFIGYGNATPYLGSVNIPNFSMFSVLSDGLGNVWNIMLNQSLQIMYCTVPKGTYVNIAAAQVALTGTVIYYQLATPITTHYDLPHLTSGKTIHRFAGEEKIALYGTGLTFSENVLTVLSAVKFVAGVMTDITELATITTNTVTFSGVNATDVVYVKVEHSVNRPLGILEHTPAVSNTASRLAELEGAYEIITDAGVQYTQFN